MHFVIFTADHLRKKWPETLTARNVAVIAEGAEATLTTPVACNARILDRVMATRLLNKVDEVELVEASIRPSIPKILPVAQLRPTALNRSAQKQLHWSHKKNIPPSTALTHKK
jgi:hypothetical protein